MTPFPRLVDEFSRLVNAATGAAMLFERADAYDHNDALAEMNKAKDALLSAHAALAARVAELEGALNRAVYYVEAVPDDRCHFNDGERETIIESARAALAGGS